jgi:hypothetical protein
MCISIHRLASAALQLEYEKAKYVLHPAVINVYVQDLFEK